MNKQLHAPLNPDTMMSTAMVWDTAGGFGYVPTYPVLCGLKLTAGNISDSPTCPDCQRIERRMYPQYFSNAVHPIGKALV